MTDPDDDDGLPVTARPPVVLLMTMILPGVLAINVYVPALPEITRVFDASQAEVQLTLTVFLIAFGISQLVMGPLSDRYGRRPVMLGGGALYVAANVVCALAFSMEALLVGRVLQAIGACVGSVITRAIVRDAWGRDRSAGMMGLITLAISIGAAIAPIAGGLLAGQFGWSAGFWFLAVLGAIPLVIGIYRLPETNRYVGRPLGVVRIVSDLGRLVAYPPYLGYCASVGAMNGMFFVFIGTAPFIMIDVMGMRPDTFGVYMLVMVAGSLIGAAAVARYGARPWGARLLTAGTALSLVGGVALAVIGYAAPSSTLGIVAPLFLIGLGNGGMMPMAGARAVALAPRLAGTASAGFGAIQLAGGAIGTVVAGYLPYAQQGPMGLAMVCFAIVGLAATLMAARPRPPLF